MQMAIVPNVSRAVQRIVHHSGHLDGFVQSLDRPEEFAVREILGGLRSQKLVGR